MFTDCLMHIAYIWQALSEIPSSHLMHRWKQMQIKLHFKGFMLTQNKVFCKNDTKYPWAELYFTALALETQQVSLKSARRGMSLLPDWMKQWRCEFPQVGMVVLQEVRFFPSTSVWCMKFHTHLVCLHVIAWASACFSGNLIKAAALPWLLSESETEALTVSRALEHSTFASFFFSLWYYILCIPFPPARSLSCIPDDSIWLSG